MKLRIAAALFTCVSLTMMSVSIFAVTASAQDGYSSGTIDPPPSRPPGQPVTNPEDPDPAPTPVVRPTAVPEMPSTPVEPTPMERPPEPVDGPDNGTDPDPGGEEPSDGGPIAPTAPTAPSDVPPAAPPMAPRPEVQAVGAPVVATANGDTTGHLVTVDSINVDPTETDDAAAQTTGAIGYGFDNPVQPSTIVMGANDGLVGSVSVTPSVSSDDTPVELAYTGPETPYIAYGGLALISAGMLALRARRRLLGPEPTLEYR